MQNQQNIALHLNLEEVNQVLMALGDQPYSKVFQLVQKIQQQATTQINSTDIEMSSAENHENGNA